MKKPILITGAGGFLGSRLTEYLRGRENCEPIPVTHRELDITDSVAVSAFFKVIKPDVVLHCASISNTGQCEAEPLISELVNVQGTANIAKASRESGCRMIFMSSDQVYTGARTMEPNREEDMLRPVNVYGRDKKRAEDTMFTYHKDAVALRLTWMYDYPVKGRVEGSHLLASLLKAAEDGEPVSLPIYDFRGLTYVWDVVHSIERIMLLPPGIYNLGSENKRSTYETAILFASVMAGRQPISQLVSPDSRRFAQMPRNLTVNTEKIKSFGIALGDTMQGFGRCCRDYGVPYPFSGKSSVIV